MQILYARRNISIAGAGKFLIFLAFVGTLALAGQTTVLYEPTSLTAGPFPSDVLTAADTTQITGHRIALPPAESSCDPSQSLPVCTNTDALNQFDGFSVNPRLMVCFSAPVDTSTLPSGLNLYAAGSSNPITVNQIIYDPATNCAFAKPNQVLKQDSAYVLTVTTTVLDAGGQTVQPDGRFTACLASNDPYCSALSSAIAHVPRTPASSNTLVAASLFTTMSVTRWLEGARDYIKANEPYIPVVPAGLVPVFPVAALASMNWDPAQSGLGPQPIPLSALHNVGAIGFGLFFSPNYLNVSGSAPFTITTAPNSPVPVPGYPSGFVPVSFHVFLPNKIPPLGGFPLAIYGHGLGDSQFGAPTYIANTLAANGIATLAFEIQGNGYGSGSTVGLTDKLGIKYTVKTPGRGVQLGSGNIGPTDGCVLSPGPIGVRDCVRQTVVDLLALVTAIQKTGGLGFTINPSRIYYVGQSFGSTIGVPFHAIEPSVKAAVINAGGGTTVDESRLAITARPLGTGYLAPYGLLNVPPANPEPYYPHVPPPLGLEDSPFNDEYVYRSEPPVAMIDNVPGALKIQAAFEAADWVGMLADPLAFAPYLKTSPLPGVPAKSTLFQFAYGDLEIPNPTESALVRAADAQSTTSYLRFDLAVATVPALLQATFPAGNIVPSLPHAVLANPDIFSNQPWNPAQTSLALAEQQQVAGFFLSDGQSIPDPNSFLNGGPFAGQKLFETPSVLPESLNYLQFPQ
ncbi:MAG: hypothetical protein JO108_02675 [Acidobacteriaceae bacterium]|nr:hypothetical protein [Acidobacteriaceae bacterium]